MPALKRHNQEYDVIVVGSGIAGLYAALKAADFARVCLLTKESLQDTNTWLAQGGIAAALGEDDSPMQHLQDTLAAGGDLCNRDMVSLMVTEGPRYVKELLELGTPFDRVNGAFALTREGAHHRNRVLHAGGDATGRCIQDTLQQHLCKNPRVAIYEHTFVTDLLTFQGKVQGVETLGGARFRAGSVILATGGLGQLYARTTNPLVATGDGVAMAYRAGALIGDMEFIQFHPTVFAGKKEGETFLVTEAMRGEGAVLRNEKGQRFMDNYHELGELGPRDVVARAIVDQMDRFQSSHVYLDITHQDRAFLESRFPTVYGMAGKHGFELSRDWLPVVPAAHYGMGGIRTGPNGNTGVEGLYACGEAACSGVHGANRLASNSLLDGLVFAARAVRDIERKAEKGFTGKADARPVGSWRKRSPVLRKQLQEAMFRYASIIRDEGSLEKLGRFINACSPVMEGEPRDREGWELKNLLTAASLVQRCALIRRESRGAHFRQDYPGKDPSWTRRVSLTRGEKGEIQCGPVAV